jgi:perosamine synthetase
MNDFIPVNEPLLDGNELKYLTECIRTGWISSDGPFVSRLEEYMALLTGRKHAIAVTNGTAAIDLVVDALGLGPGDEVIMPAFTIISCIAQIVRSGATPVLVDSEIDSWNMDVNKIESKVTSRTKAIMVVHTYGMPVEMDEVERVAKKFKLKIIEDAAEMHGQYYKGKPCGGFGYVSTLSFYANKHITCGEGGMILTDDDKFAEDCRALRNLCFKKDERFVHEKLGWNCRMTNLQAAVGLAQAERLTTFAEKKRAMGRKYISLLEYTKGISFQVIANKASENIYWVFGILLDKELGLTAKDAITYLHAKNIQTRPFFCPMHLQPVFIQRGMFQGEVYPVAEHLYKYGFYLPSGMGLTENQLVSSANTVKKMIEDFSS